MGLASPGEYSYIALKIWCSFIIFPQIGIDIRQTIEHDSVFGVQIEGFLVVRNGSLEHILSMEMQSQVIIYTFFLGIFLG